MENRQKNETSSTQTFTATRAIMVKAVRKEERISRAGAPYMKLHIAATEWKSGVPADEQAKVEWYNTVEKWALGQLHGHEIAVGDILRVTFEHVECDWESLPGNVVRRTFNNITALSLLEAPCVQQLSTSEERHDALRRNPGGTCDNAGENTHETPEIITRMAEVERRMMRLECQLANILKKCAILEKAGSTTGNTTQLSAADLERLSCDWESQQDDMPF